MLWTLASFSSRYICSELGSCPRSCSSRPTLLEKLPEAALPLLLWVMGLSELFLHSWEFQENSHVSLRSSAKESNFLLAACPALCDFQHRLQRRCHTEASTQDLFFSCGVGVQVLCILSSDCLPSAVSTQMVRTPGGTNLCISLSLPKKNNGIQL